MPRKLTRSFRTTLTTTTNPPGSFVGNPLQNLQQTELEAGEYTLQFVPIEPIDGLGFSTYALINWIVDGQQLSRVINIFQGSAISGVADAVNVKVLDQSGRNNVGLSVTNGETGFSLLGTVPGTIPAGETVTVLSQPNVVYTVATEIPAGSTSGFFTTPFTGPSAASIGAIFFARYDIIATLSKGQRGPIEQPPILITTQNPNIVLANNFLAIPVPANTGITNVLVLVVNATAPTDITVSFDANGNPLGAYNPLQQQVGPDWIPVPPGTTELILTNHNTTVSISVTVIWGIEG